MTPTLKILRRLEDIGDDAWNELWRHTEVASVFARYEWAAAWTRAFCQPEQLRLYTAWNGGMLVGILPLIWPHQSSGTAVLVGDEHSDYASLLTLSGRAGIFPALIDAACSDLSGRQRLLLRDVRSDSSYWQTLTARAVTSRRWCAGPPTPCPRTQLTPPRLAALLAKDSLRRHDRQMRQLGRVQVQHYVNARDIVPRLDQFFAQHIARWEGSPFPSLFLKASNRQFYRDLARLFDGTGLLCYTELTLDEALAAAHFGFSSERDFVWYKPAYAPALAKQSPGEVLLRELFTYAAAQGLEGFDFTRGDEDFKKRFCDATRYTRTFWWHRSTPRLLIERALS